jgi:formylmethanofuran dehydrogenase subunit B
LQWSNNVKPMAGTKTCQARHTGICLSGQMTMKLDDDSEFSFGPGDGGVLEAGHETWTVGDEACVMLETGVAA